MNKAKTFCTLHRVWYDKDCNKCIEEVLREALQVVIDGHACSPSDAIRRARRVAGLSQNGLNTKLIMARTQVHKWETARSRPRLDSFLQAMHACGYRVVLERK